MICTAARRCRPFRPRGNGVPRQLPLRLLLPSTGRRLSRSYVAVTRLDVKVLGRIGLPLRLTQHLIGLHRLILNALGVCTGVDALGDYLATLVVGDAVLAVGDVLDDVHARLALARLVFHDDAVPVVEQLALQLLAGVELLRLGGLQVEVELGNKVANVAEIGRGFPRALRAREPLPLDEVLRLVPPIALADDVLNLVLSVAPGHYRSGAAARWSRFLKIGEDRVFVSNLELGFETQ